jgi:adenylate kinase
VQHGRGSATMPHALKSPHSGHHRVNISAFMIRRWSRKFSIAQRPTMKKKAEASRQPCESNT